MLADLAQSHPVIRETFAEASEGAGVDLWSLAQQGPEETLNQTEYTQPALLAAGVAVWRAWQAQGGPQPAIYPLNLEGATPDHYEELAATLERELGALHGLVHNAALLGKPAPIELYDIEAWYRVQQVNLSAPFLLTRACLPLLRKSGEASIVFLSDEVGRRGKAYWGAYGVTKAGLEGFMRILAAELTSTDIRVNSVDPGPVRTALRRSAYPGEDVGTLPLPEQAARSLLYLLGRDGRDLHGQALSLQLERPSARA